MADETRDVDQSTQEAAAGGVPARVLSPEAQRALAEAEARRRKRDEEKRAAEKELGGREGPDPVRYGDWENDGIISDF